MVDEESGGGCVKVQGNGGRRKVTGRWPEGWTRFRDGGNSWAEVGRRVG